MDRNIELLREVPPAYKIIILGDTNVGKSSLFLRYLKDEFREAMANTIAISNDFKEVIIDGNPVHLQIWDTAGQEKFRSIVSQLYRDADGFIFVYDVNVKRSFSEMKHLITELKTILNPSFTILVGNKIDCAETDALGEETEELRKLAEDNKFKYFLASAKTGEKVNEIFDVLSRALYSQKLLKPKRKNALKAIKKWKRRFCF